MKHIILKEHTWVCESQAEARDKELLELSKLKSDIDTLEYSFAQSGIHRRFMCCSRGREMDHVIFYLHNDFYLISYYNCLNGGAHLEFKEKLIKQIISKKYIVNRYDTYRGVLDYKDLKKEITTGNIFKNESYEVHYIYGNNNKAIQSRCNFIDRIMLMDEYNKNYNEMSNKIEELFERCDSEYLQKELDMLYKANYPQARLTEIEEVKTIELLIKQIQNEIKH